MTDHDTNVAVVAAAMPSVEVVAAAGNAAAGYDSKPLGFALAAQLDHGHSDILLHGLPSLFLLLIPYLLPPLPLPLLVPSPHCNPPLYHILPLGRQSAILRGSQSRRRGRSGTGRATEAGGGAC